MADPPQLLQAFAIGRTTFFGANLFRSCLFRASLFRARLFKDRGKDGKVLLHAPPRLATSAAECADTPITGSRAPTRANTARTSLAERSWAGRCTP